MDEQRINLEAAFAGAGMAVDGNGERLVKRTVRAFKAGDYPDKKISVTEANLDALVTSFKPIDVGFTVEAPSTEDPEFSGAPIKIEHSDSPLDGQLGQLARVWRDGECLMGEVIIPDWLDRVLDRTGNKGLSLGFMRDFSAINELSLTLTPRVATAAIFSAAQQRITDGGTWHDVAALFTSIRTEEAPMPEKKPDENPGKPAEVAMSAEAVAEFSALKSANEQMQREMAELRFARRKDQASGEVEDLIRAGKLTPATREFATALLVMDAPDMVSFSKDGATVSASIAETFRQFVGALPELVDFTVKGKPADPNHRSVTFATRREFAEADPDSKTAAVQAYQKEHSIADFNEAAEKFRAGLPTEVK